MDKTGEDFVMPEEFRWEKITAIYGKFILQPLERGYATTVGNALRRVLLSSIPGCAITEVKIKGVVHEFSSLPGVVEDVPEIINNLKHVIIKIDHPGPEVLTLDVEEEGEVRANDLKGSERVEVLNPHIHIATLTRGGKLSMELKARRGRGFLPVETREKENLPLGTILVDAVFSPVRKVNFTQENIRVGERTDYERLIMEVWTNGTVTPKEAVEEASRILISHFSLFTTPAVEREKGGEDIENIPSPELLNRPLEELELSDRIINSLKAQNIETVGDLLRHTEKELLSGKNFGKKSLEEVKEVLKGLGLSLKKNAT